MSDVNPEDLRRERESVSVLKVQLARLREKDFCRLVIVLEGKDDLPVYETWINRIDSSYLWEPLIANGKGKALEFREMLRNDTTGMAICTYFVVDHDYDGLRGFTDGEDLYLLPSYSVENLLVDSRVLDSYLRTELRVISDPDERQKILELYSVARESFQGLVRECCIRLYGARNESVGNVCIRDVGDAVFIEDGELIVKGGPWLARLVSTDSEVSAEGIAAGEAFFRDRGEDAWVRGKFLLDFFKDFCSVLYADRVSETPKLFSGPMADKSLSVAGLDIRNLASKSSIPDGLPDALCRWAGRCSEMCGDRLHRAA